MGKVILIVEDEENIRNNIEEILTAEGYKCITAGQAEEALKILNNVTPDLILSDIMMPGMDGYKFYAEVRNRKALEFVPFLFLTAKVDDLSVRTGMKLGADDYIKKPFLIEDLLHSIKTRLEKKERLENLIDKIGLSISKFVPHELRTPLVSIIGNSNLLIDYYDSLSDVEKFELINSINKSGYRLLQRIEKFLKYSEFIVTDPEEYKSYFKGKIGCDPSLINIPAIMKNDFTCQERFQDVELDIQPAKIKIDEENLKTILGELISNSCQFSEKGTKIFIKGYVFKGQYLLKVKDYGKGIPPDEIGNIRAFYQLERDSTQQIGNGLGLVIVKKLLNIFDGAIEFDSKVGEFTEVTVIFPVLN